MIARKFVEGSMVAATFAEAGEHETALDIMAEASKEIKHLLSESERSGVHCYFSIKSGNPEKALESITKEHRDVAFVVSETVEDRAESRIEEGERLRTNLFVYSMV